MSKPNRLTPGARQMISEQIIKTLSTQIIREEDHQVKEVIAAAMGGIGLPEAQPCVESLIKILKETASKTGYKKMNKSDAPNVRGMAVWALGRIVSVHTLTKVSRSFLSVLQDPYFKVRAAACSALAVLGSTPISDS